MSKTFYFIIASSLVAVLRVWGLFDRSIRTRDDIQGILESYASKRAAGRAAARKFINRLGAFLFWLGVTTLAVGQTFFLDQVKALKTEEVPLLGTMLAWGVLGIAMLGFMMWVYTFQLGDKDS